MPVLIQLLYAMTMCTYTYRVCKYMRNHYKTSWLPSMSGCWEHFLCFYIFNSVSSGSRNLKVHKSMGPYEVHLRVLRELEDEVAKLLSITTEKLWQSG